MSDTPPLLDDIKKRIAALSAANKMTGFCKDQQVNRSWLLKIKNGDLPNPGVVSLWELRKKLIEWGKTKKPKQEA